MYSVHGGVLALLGAAVTSFLATNVDAIAILSPMLWSIPPGGRRYPALVGCLLGNTAVLALALLAAAGLAILPEGQLRWVGVVPIAMGVYRLSTRSDAEADVSADAAPDGDVESSPASLIDESASSTLFVDTSDFGSPVAVRNDGTDTATSASTTDRIDIRFNKSEDAPRTRSGAKRTLFAHVGLTLALGGDNIAVLAPLLRAVGAGGSAMIAGTHLLLFPLLLALPMLAARSRPAVPRLAQPASACLSIVIGAVIVAG